MNNIQKTIEFILKICLLCVVHIPTIGVVILAGHFGSKLITTYHYDGLIDCIKHLPGTLFFYGILVMFIREFRHITLNNIFNTSNS